MSAEADDGVDLEEWVLSQAVVLRDGVGQGRGLGRVHVRAAHGPPGSRDNTGLRMGRRLPRGSEAWEGGVSVSPGPGAGVRHSPEAGARAAVWATSHGGCWAPRVWPAQVALCPQCRIHSRLPGVSRKKECKEP